MCIHLNRATCLADALVTLQIDGYRFDIMGHLMLGTMQMVQAALRQLNPQEHGFPANIPPAALGPAGPIYIYGEGWDFGDECPECSTRNSSALCQGCCRLACSLCPQAVGHGNQLARA